MKKQIQARIPRGSNLRIAGIAGAMLLCLTPATASNISQIASWPGYPRHTPLEVVGDGAMVYLAVLGGLQILDWSTPERPQSRSFLPCLETGQYPSGIQAHGARLCMGIVSPKQVMGIDVSNVNEPVVVWSAPLYHQPNQVCFDGTTAYSSHNYAGLSVSTWGSPDYGVLHSTVTNAWGRVVVVGERLHVPTVFGCQIYNATPRTSGSLVGTFDAGAAVNALAITGNRAYLAATNGLHIVDLQNEASPSRLGFLPLASSEFEPSDVQLLGEYACLIFKKTNLLMVVNVSSPEAPAWVGSYVFTGPTKALSTSRGRALVLAADERYGSADLQVIELSDPSNPALETRLYANGRSGALAHQDNTLFVGEGDKGLCILDVETPSNPDVIYLPMLPGGSIAVANDWAFVGGLGGYSVYDMGVPEAPILVTNSWEPANQIQVVGDYFYRIGGFGMPELVIADVTANFAEVARKSFIEGVSQVSAFGMAGNHFALLVDEWQGNLVVIDVQSASLPMVTNYVSDTKVMDVTGRADANGTNAFLAMANGLEILDLGDPNHVIRSGSWECPPSFEPKHICVSGNRIALASTNHLWVLDMNQLGGGDPVVAEAAVTYSFLDMILSGNHLYAAAGTDGVIIYEIDLAPPGPRLLISPTAPDQVTVDWEAAGTGWFLQQKEELGTAGSWETLAGSDAVTRTNLLLQSPTKFLRLMKP